MAKDPKAKAPAAEAGAEDAAPKSKKKLIIIIAAVVLLAGGGGAGWFFMQKNAAHKKEEVKHEEPAPAPVFLKLDTFTVNLQADPDEKFLQLDIELQVANPETDALLKAQMPALKSRLLLLLSSKSASEISTSEGKQQLTDEIMAEAKKPFTHEGKPQEVLGVYFTSFVIQ